MFDMEFSPKKFKSERKKRSIPALSVAGAIGVNRTTISHWEGGRSKPSDENLAKVAEFFGCEKAIFYTSEDDITNQMRAVLRDDDGRIKHETRFDSQGNIYREHWNLELSPALWKRMKACMEKRGLVGNEVDGYLQELICEDYRKNILVQAPENQMTKEKSEAN